MAEGGGYFNEKCLAAVKYVGYKSYNNANCFFNKNESGNDRISVKKAHRPRL